MDGLITICPHEMFIEWCHECKHLNKTSVRVLLLEENIRMVQKLLSWPSKVERRITSR